MPSAPGGRYIRVPTVVYGYDMVGTGLRLEHQRLYISTEPNHE